MIPTCFIRYLVLNSEHALNYFEIQFQFVTVYAKGVFHLLNYTTAGKLQETEPMAHGIEEYYSNNIGSNYYKQ